MNKAGLYTEGMKRSSIPYFYISVFKYDNTFVSANAYFCVC